MQQLLLDEVAALAELPRDGIPTAIDGCGVLTFGMSLERMASSFSRLPEVDGGPEHRRSDDRAPRPDRLRARRDRHRSDAPAAGLDREGRGGGADLRRDRRTASASP